MTPHELDIVELTREILRLQEELRRERRRVRQLRRMGHAWSGLRGFRYVTGETAAHYIARRNAALARARDRSHDDE